MPESNIGAKLKPFLHADDPISLEDFEMNGDNVKRLATSVMRCGRMVMLFALCLACAPAQAGTSALTYEEQTLAVDGVNRTVQVPKGYRLEWLAGMDEPRMLTFAANGDLFAGSKSGKVYRLPPPYTRPEVLVEVDGYPHSVAFRPGEILIAKTDGVYRAPYRPGQASIAPDAVTLLAALPGGSGHNSRTLGIGPDGRVYVSLGIQHNCSDQFLDASYPFNDRRGGVQVFKRERRQGKLGAFCFWTAQSGRVRLAAADPHHVRRQQRAGSSGLRPAAGIFQQDSRPVPFTACPGSSSTASS